MDVLTLQAEKSSLPTEGMLATTGKKIFFNYKKNCLRFLGYFLKAKEVLQFFLFHVIFDLCTCVITKFVSD